MSNNEFQHQPISAEHGVAEETPTYVGDSNPDVAATFEDITGETSTTPEPVSVPETPEQTIARLQQENEQLRQQTGV